MEIPVGKKAVSREKDLQFRRGYCIMYITSWEKRPRCSRARKGANMKILLSALPAILALFFIPTAHAYAVAADASVSAPERFLNEQELGLYEFIIRNVTAISEGRQSAETFYYVAPTPFNTKREYEDAVEKAMFFAMAYNPELMFWEDSSGYLVYDRKQCGIIYGISPVYQAAGNKNMIDKGRLPEVKRALENAQAIVDKYSGKSDYKKLIGYADEICALNTYNKEAADGDENYIQKDINPWEIVNVFDGDPSTNVVCAGYAKAFFYLCRLGDIECHYITGSVPEGLHAWNIVLLDGEYRYVDLTWCDSFPEEYVKRDHPYVLNNVVSNSQDGFATFYQYSSFLAYDSTIYKYGEEEMKYLPESVRTLATGAYRKGFSGVPMWLVILLVPIAVYIYRFVKRRVRPNSLETEWENDGNTSDSSSYL